ncbi:hypothetical protein Lesp02_41160 [Lentzea sp. NBRC 105346]|uniref:DUF2398 family protein n=1 Tax=Lentzea sp. NBRC 105346 TaxID=3032205 RepID=UPI0024A42A7C|nr:DUF2398 family protein [Lentzea sp. NBRC 105346]GLZ31928.1 hypothetical protein Lesp02_41160 [Lentzea sp. NBRC 105346]
MNEGIRLLLANPLLTSDHDGFDLVVRNAQEIRTWFEEHCGWPLYVEKRYVLLRKTSNSKAPALTAENKPFDRRRYELLCLALAELQHTPVTTKAVLQNRVQGDETFDDVFEFLERHAILRPYEGKYLVDRELISRLTRKADKEKELMRALVDEPVVYTNQRVPKEPLEEAGFVVEQRKEGVLLVDPEGLATQERFPGDGHAETVALALLNRLPATTQELHDDVRTLSQKYRAYRETSVEELTQAAIDVLTRFGLVEQEGHTTKALPAAARYRA